MPRVKPLIGELQVKDAVRQQAETVDIQLHKAHISKQAVADMTGLTRQAVSIQFSNGRLMPEVYCAAQILLSRAE